VIFFLSFPFVCFCLLLFAFFPRQHKSISAQKNSPSCTPSLLHHLLPTPYSTITNFIPNSRGLGFVDQPALSSSASSDMQRSFASFFAFGGGAGDQQQKHGPIYCLMVTTRAQHTGGSGKKKREK